MAISASARIAASACLFLLAGAAFAGEPVLPVTPQPAPVTTSYDGFVSIAGGGLQTLFYNGGLDDTGTYVEGAARIALPLAGLYTLQADLTLSDGTISNQNSSYNSSLIRRSLEGTAHLFWRDPTFASFGVLVQYADDTLSEKSSVNNFSYDIPAALMSAGIEGQYFFGNSTLYLQLAYERITVDLSNTFDYHSNGAVLGSEFRTFFQPNLMTTLRAGYEFNRVSYFGFALDSSVKSVGAGIEYAPEHSPVSFFGSIDGLQQSYDTPWSSGEFEETVRALVGIKYNFGGKSLFERDRNGASMTPLRPHRPLLGFIIPAG